MATTQQSWSDRSTKSMSATDRSNLISALAKAGYNAQTLGNSSNDELLSLGEKLGEQENQRSDRQADRADALTDFGAQLSALTASKQRQAEQAGRIAQATTRTQGLAQMMNNF